MTTWTLAALGRHRYTAVLFALIALAVLVLGAAGAVLL